jgi:hypothetical protein
MTECRGPTVIPAKAEIQYSDKLQITWAFWITRKINNEGATLYFGTGQSSGKFSRMSGEVLGPPDDNYK